MFRNVRKHPAPPSHTGTKHGHNFSTRSLIIMQTSVEKIHYITRKFKDNILHCEQEF